MNTQAHTPPSRPNARDFAFAKTRGRPAAAAPFRPETAARRPSCWRALFALAVALALTLALSPASRAAEAGAAVIQGRVLNVANGQYLKNARVSVEGTDRAALTDDFGEYLLTGVPAGEVKLQVFYPDLAPQEATVTAAAGQTVREDFKLAPPSNQPAGQPVRLDTFVVAASRETNGKIIALGEQRYAPNIMDAVSSDQFGDVTEGNVGELMKYLPGVLVDYNAAAASTVSVRGLPPNDTPVSLDGNRMATASSSNPSRTFTFEQVSVNNIARIEVTKSAMPDQPADMLGGAVNLVSKSAFELASAVFNYRTYLSMNSEARSFQKMPLGPDGSYQRLIKPGFDFSYANPVSKSFGFVITALSSNQFNPQTLSQTNWYPISASLPGGSPAVVSGTNPYMGQYRVQTSPATTTRDSIGLTADWRIAPHDVLSFAFQDSYYNNYFYIQNYTFDVGTVATYGTDFTNGAAGKGTANTATNWRHKSGTTWQPSISWRHNGEFWTLDGGAYYSHSSNHYRDIGDGFFNTVAAGISGATVSFGGITADRPTTITVVNSAGTTLANPFDPANLRFFVTPTTLNASGVNGSAYSNQQETSDAFRGAHLNVRRNFDAAIPIAVKVGADFRQDVRDTRVSMPVWNFVGADGKVNTADDNAGPYVNNSFSATPAPYGFTNVSWLDASKVWRVFQLNPAQFTPVLTGNFGTIANAVNGSKYINEAISAAYIRTDYHFLRNRLWVVAGVRFENTADKGQGPLVDTNAIYKHDANGNLILGTNGKPILITTDTVQQTLLRYQDRGSHVQRSYNGYYPSLNATYNITDNLLARAAYGRTVGRPDFNNIIPGTTIADPTATSLLIKVNNTGLKPWEANNYDLSLEYYFQHTGVVSVGVFRKDITNFFGAVTMPGTPALLEQYGLDPTLYQGYDISTTTNVGSARVTGAEFNYSQQLTFLPDFARGLSVFANGTVLRLDGPNFADFSNFVPKNANWGLSFNRPRYTLMLKWVWRSDQRLLARVGTGVPPNDYQWLQGSLKLDVNAEYRLTQNLSLFANARNITDQPYVLLYKAPNTPGYAQQYNTQLFGVQWAFGIKGSF